MDQGVYTIEALNQKYGGFLGPAVEIHVGGKKIDSASVPITRLTVDISADGAAGNCTFTMESLYNYETGAWKNDLLKSMQAGSKLEVYGGYVVKTLLFYGYIDEFSWNYEGDAPPRVTVRGVDGLGYLMSCRDDYYAGQKTSTNAVKEILQKCVTQSTAKSVTVNAGLKKFETPMIKEEGMDDYKFLRILAERYGMVLACIKGEMIFDSLWEKGTPILSLELGRGLMSFEHRLSVYGQVGAVQIWSTDNKNDSVVGEAKNVSVGGSGKTAAQYFNGVKAAILREKSALAVTKEECTRLAQARLNSIAMEFVHGRGQCIGIPELIPGRFITIKGLGEESSKDFFISRVVHDFSKSGYFTQFEVKGAKA